MLYPWLIAFSGAAALITAAIALYKFVLRQKRASIVVLKYEE
jgi:hypothetical protein